MAAICTGSWLFPTNSPNGALLFNYNDEVVASWISNCTAPQLIVWGPSSDESHQILWNETVVSPNGTYNYTFPASYLTDFHTYPFPVHFELDYNSSSDFNGVLGDVFSVTSTSGLPTTYALSTSFVGASSTSSASATTTTSMPATSSTATPTASSSTASSSTSSGLSSGARVGIGVGVALGVSALLAVAICTYFIRRRRRRRQQQGAETGAGVTYASVQQGQPPEDEKVYETPGSPPAAELDATGGRISELSAGWHERHELESPDRGQLPTPSPLDR